MSAPRCAVLVSGSGRSLANLLRLWKEGDLPVDIVLVISSRAGVPALEHAAAYGVSSRVLPPEEVTPALDEARVDLVVLAGYLRNWPIPERYVGRAINIHPALLPRHGGPGYYGARVHQAVLDAGDPLTGCTVHFVTPDYDAGPVIARETVPVLPDDDAQSLADRVFERELLLLPQVIRDLATGHVHYHQGRVVRGP